MQEIDYIPIVLEPTFSEVYISLAGYLHGGHVILEASIDWIKWRGEDPNEIGKDASGFVRYVIPQSKGVIVAFEPWAVWEQRNFRLHFKTSRGLNGRLYIRLIRKYLEDRLWSKVNSGLLNIVGK